MKKDILENLIKTTMSFLKASYDCVIQDSEEGVQVSVKGNELNYLIGYRGDTLNSLQTFINSAYYNSTGEYVRINVDINGYRDQRKEKLEDITKNFIDRVRFFNQEVEMPPMNASERRLVHTFVSEYDDIESVSTGEGRDRRVVLKPKK